MARVKFAAADSIEGKAKAAYTNLESQGKLTNMKQVLLSDYATYDAFMGWYTSWTRLVEIIGERSAVFYAHAISTTNSCLLCSLFFISDLKELGLDPNNLQFDEKEEVLTELGAQIVKDPTAVDDYLFDQLKRWYSDSEIVAIVGFATQMIATNNFNSVLQIDVDERLLPIRGEFKPASWRRHYG